ncbi:hypothetical protein D9M68_402610 [compost metagenome]
MLHLSRCYKWPNLFRSIVAGLSILPNRCDNGFGRAAAKQPRLKVEILQHEIWQLREAKEPIETTLGQAKRLRKSHAGWKFLLSPPDRQRDFIVRKVVAANILDHGEHRHIRIRTLHDDGLDGIEPKHLVGAPPAFPCHNLVAGFSAAYHDRLHESHLTN